MPKAPGSSRNRAQVDIGCAGSAAGWAGWTRVAAELLPPPPFHPPRSIESPNLGFGVDPFLPHLLEDEQGQLSDLEPELDAQNWQHTVSRELVANLPQKEIDRQEVINGEEHGAPRGREGPPGCAAPWGSPGRFSTPVPSAQSSLPPKGLTCASSESSTSSSTSG